jgi:phospholipid/cholesterol/gamma-HCH transport system substrate-binding protein
MDSGILSWRAGQGRIQRGGIVEKEGHYVVVGVFLLLTLLIGIVFVLWLAESKNITDVSYYEIHFEGSVSGLDRGGEVRYLGVKVGQIREISLMPDQPSMVRVAVEIVDETPIYENTVAQPKLKGITGVAFIELTQGEGAELRIRGSEKPPYPVIQSRKSEIDQLLNAMPGIAAEVDETLSRLNGMLNDENIENITAIIANFKDTSEQLPELSAEVYRTLQDTRKAMNEVQRLTAQSGPVAKDTLENLERATSDMAQLMEKFGLLYAQNDERINEIFVNSMDDLEAILLETKKTVRFIRDFSAGLDERPSSLLYEPKDFGVEVAQ